LAGKKLVFSGKFAYGVEDSLKAIAEAQQGKLLDDLDTTTDFLVLADANAGKTIQKRAVALNAKGAAIQVIDADALRKLAEPTAAEILELLRTGQSDVYAKIRGPVHFFHVPGQSAIVTYHAENLNGARVENVRFDEVHFDCCRFVGAQFNVVLFNKAVECNFSRATAEDTRFGDVARSKFQNATLNNCVFKGEFSGADFTGAKLTDVDFGEIRSFGAGKRAAVEELTFAKAKANSTTFHELHLKSPNFDGADLGGSEFHKCKLESATFRNAVLRDAGFIGCDLSGADFSNADLTGANLAGADVAGANLAGANLKNANLRGARLDGVDLSRAKNYDPSGAKTGSVGPALKELDAVNAKARRIQVTFRLLSSSGDEGESIGIDSTGIGHGWGVQVPGTIAGRTFRGAKSLAFSDAMLQLASIAGHRQVRFETVDVSSTKSPKSGKELRDLVLQGIAEAFAQELPSADKLAAATKEYRDAQREKGAAERERREKAKAEAARQKEKAKKQIAKKIEKAVGKVTDVASFLKALEVRIEKPKIDKATKMLKASGFKLFNDVTDEHVSGVVKSQTDPDLVYACRVADDGQYACCTQNLNICGGLRGSICKHLLVLIIGLVQAGELDATTIDAWIAKTHSTKPELDKEVMGAIFIKYKGAEAGEVDWRPTETVPEDYYAL
jgi:uncharacterized protein YjbI with pentapeptide repeats